MIIHAACSINPVDHATTTRSFYYSGQNSQFTSFPLYEQSSLRNSGVAAKLPDLSFRPLI